MPRTLHAKDWFHSDGFPLTVERREPQEPFDLHVHDFSELVVVTGGRGMHKIQDEAWPLSAGDVFVVKGDDAHEYCELDELNLINVLYLPDRLRWDLRDLVSQLEQDAVRVSVGLTTNVRGLLQGTILNICGPRLG